MTQVGDLEHLNQLFALSEDPWHLRRGWYSDRKRDILMSSLPRARYANALEVGCGNGQLSVGLSRRAERIVGVDSRSELLTEARQRTAALSNVEIHKLGSLADVSFPHRFDLIVLNEVGYFDSAAQWAHLANAVSSQLAGEANLLACHWRHDIPGRTLETETLHGMLDSILGLTKQSHILDADFIIDVWSTSARSVAAMDGLL